jgi:hypothetical protein
VAGGVVLLALVFLGGWWYRENRDETRITDPEQRALLQSAAVPGPLRGECDGTRGVPDGAVSAIVCTPVEGADVVRYYAFPNTDAMTAFYDARVEESGAARNAPDDCSQVVDVEHAFSTARNTSGRVACFRDGGRSMLLWTMPAVRAVGLAERDDVDDQSLYDWWNVSYLVEIDQAAEPELTADETALLEHIPESFRATCQSTELLRGAVASLGCLSGDSDVFYTSYSDVDAMSAVYDAQREGAQVGTDTGRANPADCPGEGPYRVGSPDEGRILCYLDEGIARATWTDPQLVVLTEAIRRDDQFAPLMALVDRLGPS